MVTYLKNQLNDMHIFTKLFLICLLVSLSISLASGITIYHIASNIILEKTIKQTEETIQQISENYDTFMTMIFNKLDMLAFNSAVQDELKYGKVGDSEEGYNSGSRKLKRQMVLVFNSIYMEDLEIYGENGKEYFCSVGSQAPELANEEELKQIAREHIGSIVCVNDIENNGNIQIVKEIKDLLSMQPLGILRNSIRLSALENMQKNIDFAFSGEVMLLDDKNQIILGEESDLSARADDLFDKWDDSFTYKIGGRDYQVIYQTSSNTGWKTIGIIPMKKINNSVAPLLLGIAVAMLVGILLGLLLSAALSRLLIYPLKNTSSALQAFASGDFNVSLDDRRKDEFGEMNRVFNGTVKQTEQLLEEISSSRLLNKEMEFKALQAQINPHFLYNALDAVNWMARKEGEDEICEMIHAISNLLRISISNKENVFSVQKELSYVRDYLYIQKTRFQNRFTVEFDVEEEVYGQMLPKLTIQPLVENAIVHSVEVSKEKVLLVISGHRQGGDVLIQVKDNGVGISEEVREKLLEKTVDCTADVSRAHTGLGVHAVHRRIQYMYGEEYGLTVESEIGEGTCFTIRVPFQGDSLPGFDSHNTGMRAGESKEDA